MIINASADTVVKTIAGMVVAFTKTSDGSVWAAGGSRLLKINPSTLDTVTVALPFTANSSWAAWHPGSITASTSENAVFIANNATFTGGTTIILVPGPTGIPSISRTWKFYANERNRKIFSGFFIIILRSISRAYQILHLLAASVSLI